MTLTILFKRNLIVLTLILASLALTLIAFSGWNLYSHLVAEYRTKGVAVTESIARSGTELLLNSDASTLQAMIDQFLAIEGVGYVFVIDHEGEVLSHTFVPSVPEELLRAGSSTTDTVISNVEVRGGKKYIDVASPILAGMAGYVHVGMDTSIIMNSIRSAILVEIGIVMLLSLLSFFLIYFFFEKNINTPMSVLTNYANRLVAHDYSTIDLRSGDEFETLAGALKYLALDVKGMLERLDDSAWDMSRKDAELEDTLNRLNAIVENMADGLLVTDIEGKVVRTNRSMLELFQLGSEDLTGRNAGDLLGTELMALLGGCMLKGRKEVVSAEIELPGRRTGKALSAPIYNAATSGDNGHKEINCAGIVTIIRDITREKEVDLMKTDFISLVSHELRTPLTSILGFAKIITKRLEEVIFPLVVTSGPRAQKGMTQVKDNMEIIITEGERLTAIINDVLDIAKMEAGKIDWRKDTVAIGEVIERAAVTVSALFQQKKLPLLIEIEDGLPEVTADRNRLTQTMINLFSNALKFTDTGQVTCRARKIMEEKEFIEVSVSDTGVGILKEDLESVFEKFKQAGDTLTDKPRGTGLGLPICRQIVEHHGGRIWVESDTGKGSTFFFTLPLEAVFSPSTRTIALDSLVRQLKEHVGGIASMGAESGREILVVDDEANIRTLLRQELEAAGYRISEAKDGMEALGRIKEKRPDLIVLDVMMPGMSGFDVAAVLKNDPLTMDIPIVILSIIEDLERGYRIGVDRYLTKPLNTDILLTEIGALIARGRSRKKVMVVDENTSTVETLALALEARGYSVVNACGGNECLEKAALERPDMIIIDAMLSDRHDIIKTLRFNKDMEHVLFVLLGNGTIDSVDMTQFKGGPHETV